MSELSLKDRQSLIQKLCFNAKIPSDIEKLGSTERWAVYRQMVRTRIFDILETAIPLSFKQLGEKKTQEIFDHFLDSSPPRTRFFRNVVGEFEYFILDKKPAFSDENEWFEELLRFECIQWEVKYAENCHIQAVAFSFDKIPVVNSTVRLLKTNYAVEKISEKNPSPPRSDCTLCVYRNLQTHEVKIWRLTEKTAELIQEWKTSKSTATASIQRQSEVWGQPIDEFELETLCTSLEKLLNHGILLGSTNSVDSIT